METRQQDCGGSDTSKRSRWRMDGEQAPGWECFFLLRQHRLFLSVFVNDSTMEKKEKQSETHVGQIGEKKKKIQRNQRTFQMKSTWGARSVKVNQTIKIVEEYKNLVESLISVGRIKTSLGWEKSCAEVTAWSFDMERHAKECVARYCEVGKHQQSLHTLCRRPPVQKKDQLETVGEIINSRFLHGPEMLVFTAHRQA